MNRIITSSILIATLLSTGCRWEENLVIENITGTVVIPAEFVQRTYEIDGASQTVEDVANIGPVYLGLYADIEPANVIASYPHPSVGPVFDPSQGIGDTFPYGGASIGAFRSVCLQAMQCRLVTGRFVDFDAMAFWFDEVLDEPILDYFGDPAPSGEFIRQTCFAAFDYASDREIGLTAFEDRNGDDTIDEMDLDFVPREDGNYEAEFTFWQQEYAEDPERVGEANNGFTLWGWMDAPSEGGGTFSSCVPSGQLGQRVVNYNQDFIVSGNARNVLNRPASYIDIGDVVSGPNEDGTIGYVFDSVFDNPEIFLNFEVVQ